MKRRTLAITYLLVVVLLVPPTGMAQTPVQTDTGWEAVKVLPYSEALTVELKGRTTVHGTVINVTDTSLRIYKSNQSPTSGIVYDDILEVKKEDILKIYRVEAKPPSKKPLVIGALAGAAAGVALGTAFKKGSNSCEPLSPTFGSTLSRDFCSRSQSLNSWVLPLSIAGGAITGSVVGFMFMRPKVKRVLIYESK